MNELRAGDSAYETPDAFISFVPGYTDRPCTYTVVLKGEDELCIPYNQLERLTAPGTTTEEVLTMIDSPSGEPVKMVLRRHGITPTYFHLALLHLRISEDIRKIQSQTEEITRHRGALRVWPQES